MLLKRFGKLSFSFAAVMALAVTVTACGNSSSSSQGTGGGQASQASNGGGKQINIQAGGSSFINPLMQKWIKVYGKDHKNVVINYQSVGSGAGQQQLKAGTFDFAGSDAFMTDAQIKQVKSGVVHVLATFGAEAITYNLKDKDGKAIGKGLKLTPATLSGIYLGKIKYWDNSQLASDNPNMKLPHSPIVVVHRADGSGTTAIYTDYLSHVSSTWKSQVGQGKSVDWPVGIGGKGNEGVSAAVKNNPGSIGYVELAYAVDNKLPFAQLKNEAGNYEYPTLAAAAQAAASAPSKIKNNDVRISLVDMPGDKAYGIVGQTWILLRANYQDAAKKKAIIDFVKWAETTGQQYSNALEYAKVPAPIVKINDANIATIK